MTRSLLQTRKGTLEQQSNRIERVEGTDGRVALFILFTVSLSLSL